jgi:hypothetical protein
VPGFRTDDLVTIRRANGIEDGELDWNRTDGVARAPADELLVSLRAGDWVAYEIAVPSPSRLQIAVALKSSEAASGNGLVVDISIDGTRVLVEDHTDAMVNGSTDQLSAGRHIVRLTGLLGDALVRWIEVIPASGG